MCLLYLTLWIHVIMEAGGAGDLLIFDNLRIAQTSKSAT